MQVAVLLTQGLPQPDTGEARTACKVRMEMLPSSALLWMAQVGATEWSAMSISGTWGGKGRFPVDSSECKIRATNATMRLE